MLIFKTEAWQSSSLLPTLPPIHPDLSVTQSLSESRDETRNSIISSAHASPANVSDPNIEEVDLGSYPIHRMETSMSISALEHEVCLGRIESQSLEGSYIHHVRHMSTTILQSRSSQLPSADLSTQNVDLCHNDDFHHLQWFAGF